MKIKKLIIIVILLLTFITIFMGIGLKQLNDIKWKSDKDYYSFVVNSDDLVNYEVFIHPYGKFEKLKAIDIRTRQRIAQYMKDNKLSLAEGEQCFDRINYTYEELIYEYFKFSPN